MRHLDDYDKEERKLEEIRKSPPATWVAPRIPGAAPPPHPRLTPFFFIKLLNKTTDNFDTHK
jgi:hypothetical protein